MSVDIQIKHTEDFILDLQILDGNNDPVADLVGAVGTLQIRSSVLSDTVLASAIAVITPSTGSIQFTVPDSVMTTLLADGDMRRSLAYGVKITYLDEIDDELISGKIKLYRGVVR